MNESENESIDDFFSRQREALVAGDSEEQKRWYVEEFQRREGARSKRTKPWRYLGYVILALLALYFIFFPWQEGFVPHHMVVPHDMMSFLTIPFLLSVVWLVAVVGFMVARKELKCPKCHREVRKPVKGLCAHCGVKLLFDTPKRRWYRVRLRTAVGFVMAVLVPCSWLGAGLHRAHRNRLAANDIQRIEEKLDAAGGRLSVVEHGPRWPGRLLGDPGRRYADRLQVVDKGSWDDEGMAILTELPNTVRSVNLQGTPITNAGLVHLKEHRIRDLDLSGTDISDAGLDQLETLTALRKLDLRWTDVTGKGVKRLQEALPLCEIHR